MITLYGINNCDTIKKTRAWLDGKGIDYQFHDYKKAGCPSALAKRFLSQFSVQEIINTRGTTWRKLPESVRANLDEKLAVKLMSEYPSLIKRPLIEAGSNWCIGYDEERMSALVKS